MMYYFAYGSNMDVLQMKERCPSAKSLGVSSLGGYRFSLDYEGVATIIPDSQNKVWGVLWEIQEDDKASLDRYEGVASHCYGPEFIVVGYGVTQVEALVYISLRKPNSGNRRSRYMERIIQSAYQWNLPKLYINQLELFYW